MAANAPSSVVRQLRFVVASWKEDVRTDVELLQRFVQSRDEQSFTTLVGRHSEMVWGVCSRILRNTADAEDALQATFLRLARDAGRIANREALAGWLFRVARVCAIDLHRSIARQRRIEERLAAKSACVGSEPTAELRVLLEDELALLSNSDRAVLVLVGLQGRTYADAALELGCSVATVHRRFVRAQTRLRRRLARRGPGAAGVLAAAFAMPPAASAAPPALLGRAVEAGLATARTSTLPAGRAGALAAASAADTIGRGSIAAAAVTLALALAGGLFAALAPAARDPAATASHPPPVVERPQELTGVVRDAGGRPLPGARLSVLARQPFAPGERGLRDAVLTETTTDEAGRFSLRVPDDFATWFPDRVVTLHASAPGLTPATLPVRDAGTRPIELTLARGVPLRGRLLGPDGRPAQGVRVEVVRVGLAAVGAVLNGPPGAAPRGWPAAVATDAGGEFAFPDLGGCENVWVRVSDARFAAETLRADEPRGDFRLDAAVPLEVEVREADTDRPLAGARVTVITDRIPSHPHFCATDAAVAGALTVPADTDAVTDAAGRVAVAVARGDRVEVLVHPPDGGPPLVGVRTRVEAGDATLRPVVKLPRGRWVEGAVTDETGRPLPGATVHWGRDDATRAEWRDDFLVGRDALTRAGPDGRFRVAVLPGPCSIRAYGPTLDYVAHHAAMAGTANTVLFAHETLRLDVRPDRDPDPITLRLRAGVTVAGRAEQPPDATRTFVLCSGRVSPVRPYASLALAAPHGRFAVPGCRRGHVVRAYLLDPVARVGAGVSLAACGKIRIRALCPDGRPAAGEEVNLSLLVDRERGATDEPVADPQPVGWFDTVNYRERPRTDASGRVELPALIPGAQYALTVGSGAAKRPLGRFVIEPGATLDLPDMVLEPGGTK